jgi:hypothetical protein
MYVYIYMHRQEETSKESKRQWLSSVFIEIERYLHLPTRQYISVFDINSTNVWKALPRLLKKMERFENPNIQGMYNKI